MADTPISSLTVFVGTLPAGTYLEIATPDPTSSTGYSSYRGTAEQVSATVTGFVPTTRAVNAGIGLTGGGALTTDVTLNFGVAELNASTSMAVADSFAINDVVDGNIPRKVTFPNAMKALTGLPILSIPNLTTDFLIINRAADGSTYKISPSAFSLATGNMPAGGTTGQQLIKLSNTNYDTIWSTGSFLDQSANVVFSGPASGGAAQPAFRALVAADLPDPTATTKGGVKSYAAVSNQFLTSITTAGAPVSAQPSFSNISGTATVGQGGTGAITLTNHGILLGQGTSAIAATTVMTDGQLLIGQSASDPLPKTVSGDVTISAIGVTAIGANKVTDAMLRQGAALSVIGVAGSSTANVADIAGIANQILRVNGAGTALAFGSIDLAQSAAVGSSILPVANGGTNIASYAVGDILYASGATTLAKLADVATGNAMISGGVTTAPAWGKIGLATHVSGTLPIANGGTGQTTANLGFNALAPTTTRGDIITRDATVNVRLAIGAANTVLRTNGTDPAWGAVDLATDTTGQLIVANGGTGDAAFTQNGILYGNNASAIQVTAAGTNGTVLIGNTGAAPSFGTVSAVLDAIGNTQGNILYRSASGWNALAVGTSGQVLSTQGAGADPHWISAAGVGTVTSVDVSGGTTGITATGGPITAAGTITLAGTLATANGGTALTSYTQGDLLYASSSSVLAKLAKDTNATRYLSNTGSSNNPAWAQISLTTGVSGNLPSANLNATITPQGRLTLVTAVPVMVSTQSAKTTIYYTPYQGNLAPIYDGTNMLPTVFTELSVLTTDTTKSPAAIGASKVNDWFVWNDSGTIRIGHGPDWTDDTTRSAGTALTRVNGILLNNASITNGPAASRGTYVGTTRSDGSSQLNWIYGASSSGGTAAVHGVWNAYNRVDVLGYVQDSTANWTYTTNTWRAANNSSTMRASFISGLAEDQMNALYMIGGINSALNGFYVGIGFNSTSAASGISGEFNTGTASQLGSATGYYGTTGLGFNYFNAIEASDAAGTTTWYSVNSKGAFGMQYKFRM